MEDKDVRTILGHVRGMAVGGHSPVDYIDGVLDGMPNAYGNIDLNAINRQGMPKHALFDGPQDVSTQGSVSFANMDATKALF